ncbi:hypothetical protein HELRODRAFT_180016 [Helobdella robusta]|uniref:Uncharacterized protein n=1 Tax=Helobdella robusta TaxID=6412 RepID=T1FFC6_HELRO|nr:hypothetical protein HELRODRAFT_180016 [Helobdella robusta]ESN94910.1 hypothetical protein HELRODRAFT_180016 [Helobdella robusta]
MQYTQFVTMITGFYSGCYLKSSFDFAGTCDKNLIIMMSVHTLNFTNGDFDHDVSDTTDDHNDEKEEYIDNNNCSNDNDEDEIIVDDTDDVKVENVVIYYDDDIANTEVEDFVIRQQLDDVVADKRDVQNVVINDENQVANAADEDFVIDDFPIDEMENVVHDYVLPNVKVDDDIINDYDDVNVDLNNDVDDDICQIFKFKAGKKLSIINWIGIVIMPCERRNFRCSASIEGTSWFLLKNSTYGKPKNLCVQKTIGTNVT